MKSKNLFILILLAWFLIGCVNVITRVSSISHQEVPLRSSFHVLPGNNSIESKKIVRIIGEQLQLKDYKLKKLEDADIIVSFSARMVGAKTKVGSINTPIQTSVYNPSTGFSSLETTGYTSHSYSTTQHQREIRIEFHDGKKLRAKEKETISWEAVGKSSGSTGDIIGVAPGIIASIFEEIGKDSDSRVHSKAMQ